jgi:hypothetical protein
MTSFQRGSGAPTAGSTVLDVTRGCHQNEHLQD